MEMLELNNLHKTFNPGTVNEKVALNGVSLHMEAGDFATIVGSNGAGKSTMFNAITGGFIADEGSIVLGGQDITFAPEHQRSKVIGHLFQDPLKGTAPNMTIEENLALAARRGKRRTLRIGITKAEREQYRELLGGLGLGDLSGLLDLSLGSELLGGNADENDNLGLDLAVQRDGNGVGTGNLDGLTELDALAVDVHTELSLDGVSDHSGGNGAKEDALVADLDINGDRLALEGSLGLVGGSQTDGLALGDVVATLVKLLEVALGGGNSELLGEQEVARVAIRRIHNLILLADTLHIFQQNNLHNLYPP